MYKNIILLIVLIDFVSGSAWSQIGERVNDGVIPIVTVSGVGGTSCKVEFNFDKDYTADGKLKHYPDNVYAGPEQTLTKVSSSTKRYATATFALSQSITRGKMRAYFYNPNPSTQNPDGKKDEINPILEYTVTNTVNLETAVSADEQFLMRPTGANQISRIFIGVLSRSAPVGVPDGFRPVTNAVAISAYSSSGTTMRDNYVRWRYNVLGGSVGAANIRLYRWDPTTLKWVFAKGCLEVNTEAREVFLNLVGQPQSATFCLFAPVDNGALITPVTTTGVSYSFYAAKDLQVISTIGNGTNLTAMSNEGIKLQPGFVAVSGSKFKARLVCSQNAECSAFTFCTVSTPSAALISDPEALAISEEVPEVPVEQEVQIAALPPSPDGQPVLFPNPVMQEFTIRYQLSVAQPVTIAIYNLQGKEVLLNRTAGGENWNTETFQVGNLPSGMYMVRLSPAYQESVTFRIVKR